MVLPSLNRGYTAAKYAIVDPYGNEHCISENEIDMKTFIKTILVIEIC